MSASGAVRDPGRPQRWYVAALYADLSRSTEFAVNMEAELYGEVLDRLRQIYQQVTAAHGGSLLQVHGDGMLAMFGFPSAGEEDVRLALNAALDLHEQVRNLRVQVPEYAAGSLELRLHSGVHAGIAVIEAGDIFRGTYQLRGDVANVCARLSSLAEEDEILVSAQSFANSSAFFRCGELRRLTVRGMSEPLTVVPVLARSELTSRYQARRARSRLPFIGRKHELELLNSAWREVSGGASAVVSVVGEPGVGKTRLVDEFLGLLGGAHPSLRGQCETLAQARPLEPFLTMAEVLPDAPVNRTADVSAQADMYLTVLESLRNLAQASGLILFIDDWHWADEMTRRLLVQLNATTSGNLIVLTRRTQPGADTQLFRNHKIVRLDGLKTAEVSAAIGALAPNAEPAMADQIRTLAGGNPLYLEALCELGPFDHTDHAPSAVAHVPQWLYSLVQAKVVQLAARERQLVYAAAVIGSNVPVSLWRRIEGFDDSHALTGLALLDLMYPSIPGEEWHFKHGLTREIVYHLIDLRERQRLHRLVADELSKQPDTAERIQSLANHYYGAGDYPLAAQYAHRAGDDALAAPALDIARAQYHRALECIDRGELSDQHYRELVKVTKRLSYVALLDPARQEVPIIERTLRLAEARDDLATRALTNFWLGNVHYGLGEPRLALRYQYRAQREAEELRDTKLARQIAHSLAQATAANCDHEQAKELLREAATAQHDDLGPAEKSSIAYSLGCLGMVLGDQGHFPAAHEAFAGAFALVGHGHLIEANVLAKAVAVRVWQGDWPGALAAAERVIALSEEVKNVYLLGMARVLHAYAAYRLDGDRTHVALMLETTHWLEQCGNGQFLSLNYGWLAQLGLEVGDVDALRHFGAKALARARKGDGFGLASAARALSLAASRHGWHRPGAHYLALADASAQRRASPREVALNDWCRAQLAEFASDSGQARLLRSRVEASFEALQMDWHLSAVQRARA